MATQIPPITSFAPSCSRTPTAAACSRGIYAIAWLVVALVALGLVASLLEAALRGGWRAPRARPPIELWFVGPIAAVLVGVSVTAHRAIAPAVTLIAAVGLALGWLSGATLELLRARGRPTRLRGVIHVAACTVAIVAVAYIALTRDGLLDLLVETVRFGPEN